MKIVKTFNTREEASAEKKRLAVEEKYVVIHTDYIDDKFVVTFVNGDDSPANSEESKQRQQKMIRLGELNKKLQDNSINFDELKELMRG